MKNKRFLLFFLLVLNLVFQSVAQEEVKNKLEQGLTVSYKKDRYTYHKGSGMGIEGGYYLLKQVGKKSNLSLDIRISFLKGDIKYERHGAYIRLINPFGHFYSYRTGTLNNLKNVAIVLPIKYRYQVLKNKPFYFLVGINPIFNISGEGVFEYVEYGYDQDNDILLYEKTGREKVGFKRYSYDNFLGGIGFHKSPIRLEFYYQTGYPGLSSPSRLSANRQSLVLNVCYGLSWKKEPLLNGTPNQPIN